MPKRAFKNLLKFCELLAHPEKLTIVKFQAALTRTKQMLATAGLTELFSPVSYCLLSNFP